MDPSLALVQVNNHGSIALVWLVEKLISGGFVTIPGC